MPTTAAHQPWTQGEFLGPSATSGDGRILIRVDHLVMTTRKLHGFQNRHQVLRLLWEDRQLSVDADEFTVRPPPKSVGAIRLLGGGLFRCFSGSTSGAPSLFVTPYDQ